MLASPASLDAAVAALAGRRVLALTGAGCSTRSGIPDYRGAASRGRRRIPLEIDSFLADPTVRHRYWARATAAWATFRAARPNPAHVALARLEAAEALDALVTQNVDGLHQQAGSNAVVELHGSLARTRCLSCGAVGRREELHARLLAANPEVERLLQELAPDGDGDLPEDVIASFVLHGCVSCGGDLRPDVVFFGESVPVPVASRARAAFDGAEALLVAGTSLAVFSGYRWVKHAVERGLPVVLVNLGPTRADGLAVLRLEADVAEALPRLAALLDPRR